MNLHNELLRQARHLATKEPRRPLQASLRRAVSAAYYALFHLLVDDAVRRMVTALQPELELVAATFVDLQHARHEADYNTAWRPTRPDAWV